MDELYIYPYNDYRYYLMHSSKGTSWSKKDHKYTEKIKKENGKYRYVYGPLESVTPGSIEAEKTANRRNQLIEEYDDEIKEREYSIQYLDDKIADFERKAGREPDKYSVKSRQYKAYINTKKKYENELNKAKQKRAALDMYNDSMIDALASKYKHHYSSRYDKMVEAWGSDAEKKKKMLHRKPR